VAICDVDSARVPSVRKKRPEDVCLEPFCLTNENELAIILPRYYYRKRDLSITREAAPPPGWS
jgi:hypothetical protein